MRPLYKRLLITGLIAGTLDILSAYVSIFIKSGRISKHMFQYIAGGALGLKNSMDGGIPVILLGIFFHYFIAFSFTLFFFYLYRKYSVVRLNKYLSALLYGFFIWAVMNLIVLPLSALPASTITFGDALQSGSILAVMIGLPSALSASAYYDKLKPISR